MSTTTMLQPAREVPVLGEYDVLVCGGGAAGCAAALGAARHGARVLLVEQEGFLGGATVAQLVFVILSTNGRDFQGVWHDWIRALRRYDGVGPLQRQEVHGSRWYVDSVHPEAVKFAWDDLLTDAGVNILHHVLLTDTLVEDGAIRGVIVETRSGPRAIRAARVIDATGDGIVGAAAGVPFESGAHGTPYAMGVGMMARLAGLPVLPGDSPSRGTRGAGRASGPHPDMRNKMHRVLKVDPLDPWDLTRASREGRRMALASLQDYKDKNDAPEAFLLDTAPRPGIRSSRRLQGMATVTKADAWTFVKYDDGIARSSWEVDIHSPTDPTAKGVPYNDPAYTARAQGAREGDWFDIRYGCVVAEGIEHLLVAGRCLSAEHEAQSSLRIQQTCMSTGEAAGVAAALSLDADQTPRELDPQRVVKQLATDRDVEPAFDCLKDLPAGEAKGA